MRAAWVMILPLAGCLGTAVEGMPSSGSGSGSGSGSEPMPQPGPVPMPPVAAAVRIAAGATATYVDPDGHEWAADHDASGGTTVSTDPPVAIVGTSAPQLFNSERYGAFAYALAVPNGTYTVRLGFAELYVTAAGQRLFDIAVQGQKLETAFDIFGTAGAMNTAVVRSYPATVTDGKLSLEFQLGSIQNPKVNTIEVIPVH
jgi:hypothetical protein